MGGVKTRARILGQPPEFMGRPTLLGKAGRPSVTPRRIESAQGGRGLRIKFEPLSTADGLGKASKNVIELNANHEFVRLWREHGDLDLGARILANQALWIYETSPDRIKATDQADFAEDDQTRSQHTPARVGARLSRLIAEPESLSRATVNGVAR